MKSEQQRAAELIVFDRLYRRVIEALSVFGEEDALLRHGDYWIHGDYWGVRQLKVYLNDRLVSPAVIEALRLTLHDLPDWEIVVAACPNESAAKRPDMGLRIRHDVVLEALIRDYLQEPQKSAVFKLGRPLATNDVPMD